MAYVSRNLSVLAYANGFTLWHYATPDASVTTANYFDPAAAMLRVGDMIIVNLDTDGTPSCVQYRVASVSGSVVALAAL